jgi:hypothetical protein
MFPKIVSMLAPIGAALAIVYSSLTGYSILLGLGSALREDQTVVLPSGHVIGAIGLLLFGLGVTTAAFSPRTRSTLVICIFIGGMIAFGLAVLLIGFGNWQLSATFASLASAERVDSESFIREAGNARLPLLVGWCFVLGGAVSIFAADVIAERASRPRAKSMPGGIAVAVAFFALLIFLVSGVWSMISLRGLEGDLSSPQIDPASIASGVVGVINSAFLTVIGIAGCAFASLLLAVATGVPAHQCDDEQTDEREPE